MWDFPTSASRSASPRCNTSEFPAVSGWGAHGRRGFDNASIEQVVEPLRYHRSSEIFLNFREDNCPWNNFSRSSLLATISVPEVSSMCVRCGLLR